MTDIGFLCTVPSMVSVAENPNLVVNRRLIFGFGKKSKQSAWLESDILFQLILH